MNKLEKIQLNRLAYYLRKLPENSREYLAKVIKDECDDRPSYLAEKIFDRLTGSRGIDMKSPFARSGFSDVYGKITSYPDVAPFYQITVQPVKAKKFYTQLFRASEIIVHLNKNNLDAYLLRITAPDTLLEKAYKQLAKIKYNATEYLKVKPLYYARYMTHKRYRDMFNAYKERKKS